MIRPSFVAIRHILCTHSNDHAAIEILDRHGVHYIFTDEIPKGTQPIRLGDNYFPDGGVTLKAVLESMAKKRGTSKTMVCILIATPHDKEELQVVKGKVVKEEDLKKYYETLRTVINKPPAKV